MALKFETAVVGPFQENCFIVWDDTNMRGALIDPGDEPERLLKTISSLGVKIEGIFNTHGHLDHAGAVAPLQEKLEIPFAIHEGDTAMLESMPSQCAMFGLPAMDVPKVDRVLAAGETICIGSVEGRVIHTPGHTPGGVCFEFGDFVFVGDTLFAGSIGRTDLPGGNHKQLIDSIKTQLLTLADDTKVLCGHGPATTIGYERKGNPFL